MTSDEKRSEAHRLVDSILEEGLDEVLDFLHEAITFYRNRAEYAEKYQADAPKPAGREILIKRNVK